MEEKGSHPRPNSCPAVAKTSRWGQGGPPGLVDVGVAFVGTIDRSEQWNFSLGQWSRRIAAMSRDPGPHRHPSWYGFTRSIRRGTCILLHLVDLGFMHQNVVLPLRRTRLRGWALTAAWFGSRVGTTALVVGCWADGWDRRGAETIWLR